MQACIQCGAITLKEDGKFKLFCCPECEQDYEEEKEKALADEQRKRDYHGRHFDE